jgi:hypothetical protein
MCLKVCPKAEGKDVGWKGVSPYWVCKACVDAVFLCPTCRQVRKKTELGTDGVYCINCLSVRHQIYRGINSAGFHPVPKFFGKNGPFYGIELECDVPIGLGAIFKRDQCMAELHKLQSQAKGSFYVKSDGSLTNGIEIVSHPHSIEAWDKQSWLAEATQLVKDFGGSSFNTDTCGVHVHRGKADLTDLHLSMLVVVFVRLQPYFEKIAQRRQNGYCKYAFFRDGTGEQKIGGLNGKVIYKAVKEGTGMAVDRYQALNLKNIDTIECRIFRGTLFPSSILAYIHFLYMTCEFVKDRGTVLGKLLRYSIQDLWDMLYEFMAIDPILKTYLDEKQITKRGTKAANKVVPVPRDADFERAERQSHPTEQAEARGGSSSIAENTGVYQNGNWVYATNSYPTHS